MATLNLCQFIGNIGGDPEIRYFDGGGKVANARIAVSERFVDKNNTQQERTEWISLVFNSKLVDVVEKYVRKGSTIYVSGKWHNREWQDQAGNKRQTTELTVLSMQLLDKPQAQQTAPAPAPGYAPQPAAPAPAPGYQAPPAPPQYQQAPGYGQPIPPASPAYQQPAPAPAAPAYPTAPAAPAPQPGYAPGYGPAPAPAPGEDLPF